MYNIAHKLSAKLLIFFETCKKKLKKLNFICINTKKAVTLQTEIVIKPLKYFFCISSNLAYSICDLLIQLDGLPISDCVFLTTRNYQLPPKTPSYHAVETGLNASKNSGRLFAGWRVRKTISNIRQFDQLVNECTKGDDYFFYTQVCCNDICSVCVTNPRCKGYYIIEDGSASYRKDDIVTFQGWKAIFYRLVLKPLFPRIYTLKGKMVEVDHPKFKGCIATNQLCFPNHQDKLRVIGMPFHPEPLDIALQALISLDPYYLWLTDVQVQSVLEKLGTYITKKNYLHVAYKPHPYLLTEENHERYIFYKQCMHRYIKADLIELGAQVSLENTLMAHKDCDFYTAVSSVAIYAKAMGIKCYTFAPIMRQYCNLSVPEVEDKCIPINIKQ